MRSSDETEATNNTCRYDSHAFYNHIQSVADETERELLQSIETGFFDSNAYPEAPFVPRLLKNDLAAHENVLSILQKEMSAADEIDLSIAFIASSGIQVLMQSLLDLQARNVPVRLLSSTYLNFNDPDAIEKLRQFANIDMRVYEGPLHTKGYIFSNGNMRSVIVGSSNLTQSALLTNAEWNLQLASYKDGEVWRSVHEEFERVWNARETVRVTDDWVSQYRMTYKSLHISSTFTSQELTPRVSITYDPVAAREKYAAISPNTMQIDALKNLRLLRENGARRALLISATGTGKTYLSAFDVKAFGAKRALFVVHRERIASDALQSFKRVIGNQATYGIYSGSRHEKNCDFVFSTVMLLGRHLEEFDPQEFDYLVIDEAHRSGGETYQKVLSYFKPKFTLGMTATPDRTDGYNIYDLFDNNIAYRITLQKAQESEMLAPFHYFGITDLNIDGCDIDDFSTFAQLVSDQRIEHVVEQIERYSVETVRRGLVFCRNVAEAHCLSDAFNKRGYRTCALDGSSSDYERSEAIERLECDRSTRDDWLEYIFTRDIFNEGIDIPSVNQVIMLRPTESAIIFVQQLGRGLRLHDGKDYVLVLDFIGNYQQSFLIPVALSGDKSFNKDNLRRFMREGNRLIPGCSTISFDAISEKRVYRMLDAARFSDVKRIKQEYLSLKYMLGRIPTLQDFCSNGSIEPELIFSNKSLGSYHAFLSKYEKDDYHVSFTPTQEQMLKFVSQKLAYGKRPQELLLLRSLLHQQAISSDDYSKLVTEESDTLPVAACNVSNVLGGAFLTGGQAKTFDACNFISFNNGVYRLSDRFAMALRDHEFKSQLEEVIQFGLMRYRERYSRNYRNSSLVLYQKYTYEDVCRLLDWSQNLSGQNIGGYKYDEATNTFPVFINYEKSDEISATIRYHDRFLSPSQLIAISKQPRHITSPEIVRLASIESNGMTVYLFVRKNKADAESKEFYFLGEMYPTGFFKEFVMEGTTKPAVEIGYRLETPVPDELYDYLTSGEQ